MAEQLDLFKSDEGVSLLSEPDANSIDDLSMRLALIFNTSPLEYTEDDLSLVLIYYEEQRIRFNELEIEKENLPKKVKKVKEVKEKPVKVTKPSVTQGELEFDF
jgi:hypothetical protein